MDDGTCPQWLAKFAFKVNRTIRQHGAMAVIREMLEAWMVDMEAQGDELSDWEKRFGQYVDKVRKTPELRDSKAFHTNPATGETGGGLKWCRLLYFGKEIWCWAPSEFRIRPETRPTYDFPLPPTDRCLSKPERYAALAAVHDQCCKGVEKVTPWPKPGPFSERQDEKRYEMYGSLLERVGELRETDLPALKALLDEAEEGLANSADEPTGKRRNKPGPKPSKKDKDRDKDIYDAHKAGLPHEQIAQTHFGDPARTRDVELAIDRHRHR